MKDERADGHRPHSNQNLFSDHYLDKIFPMLPLREKWIEEAEPIRQELKSLYDKYTPSSNEPQTEDNLIKPILKLLGHTFEVQASLHTPQGTKKPDYIFYRDPKLIAKNKNVILSDEILRTSAYAVGDAKYWDRPLDVMITNKATTDPLDNRVPAFQISFYMQHSGVEWGILTNGRKWRLYHKDTAHKLDHCYEVDLPSLLVSENIYDFLYFYVFFRRQAFDPQTVGLNTFLQASRDYATEVGNALKLQVYDALRHLAQGFLDNPANGLTVNTATLLDIYDHSLIVLYRLLFIQYAEARELLPITESLSYASLYSLQAISKDVGNQIERGFELPTESRILWERLTTLFGFINDGNPPLKIATFNGGLFDPERHSFLKDYAIGDYHLQKAIDKLARVKGEFVDYRDLSIRHLGTIYEGLLEFSLQPYAEEPGWSVVLLNSKGQRKTSGSYYTPDEIVRYIVTESLRPILSDAIDSRSSDKERIEAVLSLKILDPAMGSAHFLVEAVDFAAQYIVDRGLLPAGKTREEADVAYWKRRVAQSCIYGVDLNPLAVELAKLALWLTTVAKDRPLSFLDHHLRTGNSLVGARLDNLRPCNGKKRNGNGKKKVEAPKAQLSLFEASTFALKVSHAVGNMWLIEESPAETVEEVKNQEKIYLSIRDKFTSKYCRLANLSVATYFGLPVEESQWETVREYILTPNGARFPAIDTLLQKAEEIATRECFFHWELEFPEVYFDRHGRSLDEEAGFDAIISNPPWERVKLAQNEFFVERDPAIASAPRASDRKRLIKELLESNPTLRAEYDAALQRAEYQMGYLQTSGVYPLMGHGDTNYYAIFAEKALHFGKPQARIGLVVPSGIATDDSTKAYFQHIVSTNRLLGLFDFENKKYFFPEVHASFKFTMLMLNGSTKPKGSFRCGFYMHRQAEMDDPDRVFELTVEDLKLFNPNTLTCPIFRRKRDMVLTRKIYENVRILINLSDESGNPWGIAFKTMFHMTNDSHLFKTAQELKDEGYWPTEDNTYQKGSVTFCVLYEGKMVQMYDHRAANITRNPENIFRPAQQEATSLEEHQDPSFLPQNQYWVPLTEIQRRLELDNIPWLLGFKEITAPTNMRSFIVSVLPFCGYGNKIPLVIFQNSDLRKIGFCMLANMNSFVMDYAARQKIGGQTLNYFIVEQFPVLPPARYDEPFHGVLLRDFISERVLELCYTAWDLKGFAEEMGYSGPPFPWDEERRLYLRCQLDALYFHLYGLTREEAGDILETFPIVKRQDEEKYNGKFRTKDLILAYYNAYAAGNMDAKVKG